MSTAEGGGNIVTDGLVLYLDAANTKSIVSGSTTWNDLSRGGNNGTLISGSTFDSGNGGSLVFDGSSNYVLGDTVLEPQNNALSISTWFKPTGPPSNNNDSYGGVVLVNTNQANISYALGYSWANQCVSFNTKVNDLLTSSNNSVLRNSISYITAIFNGSQQLIYLNGQLLTSRAYTIPLSYLSSGDRFFRIGQWGASGFPRNFNGRIYQMSMYNRALSSQEILQNYNATKARYGL